MSELIYEFIVGVFLGAAVVLLYRTRSTFKQEARINKLTNTVGSSLRSLSTMVEVVKSISNEQQRINNEMKQLKMDTAKSVESLIECVEEMNAHVSDPGFPDPDGFDDDLEIVFTPAKKVGSGSGNDDSGKLN